MEHFVENFNGFVALRTLSIFVLEIFPFNMGKEILAHRGKKRLEVPTKQWACTWHLALGSKGICLGLVSNKGVIFFPWLPSRKSQPS